MLILGDKMTHTTGVVPFGKAGLGCTKLQSCSVARLLPKVENFSTTGMIWVYLPVNFSRSYPPAWVQKKSGRKLLLSPSHLPV